MSGTSGMGRARGTTILRIVVPLLILAAVLYGGRVLWLLAMATEGDVPSIAAVGLPAGTEVLGQTTECASGGCWVEATVSPPDGMTPEELAAEIGATPQARIPGNLLDPRTVSVHAEPRTRTLMLRLDYFSPPEVP
ncbi:hypothetical protein ACXET9_12675 [Brachybacterium sp. DNPG3]